MTRRPREWTAAELAAMAAWEAQQVARGLCPHSGLPISPQDDGRAHCTICDCNGYEVRT